MNMDKFPRIIPTLIQIRAQTYDKMLKSLGPESWRLLGQVVGELAVSADPDLEAVAQQLEIALTTKEKKAISDEAADLEEQVGQAIEALKQAIIQSGEPHTFGHSPMPRMTSESPGMTLVSLSIEELMINLNRFKKRDEDQSSHFGFVTE
jgi:hypothetical protein